MACPRSRSPSPPGSGASSSRGPVTGRTRRLRQGRREHAHRGDQHRHGSRCGPGEHSGQRRTAATRNWGGQAAVVDSAGGHAVPGFWTWSTEPIRRSVKNIRE
jgi:hypothetical protein